MKITYENNEVVIRVPCTPDIIAKCKMSGSGKNRMLATTGGFKPVDGAPSNTRVSLNIIADKE